LTFTLNRGNDAGVINRVRMVDEDSLDEPYVLYLFDDEPSTIADADTFAPTVDDLAKMICAVTVSTWTTVNSLDYWHSANLNYLFATAGKLYGYLVCTDTPDFVNADALSIYLDVAIEG